MTTLGIGVERNEQGQLVCRECGKVWVTDEAVAALLEQLVAHSGTHTGQEPDQAKPVIYLR